MGAVAKAHPKVKARARPVRRAGRGAPVRRRPAVRGGDVGWKDGVVMKVEDIKLDELEKDLHLVLMDASYYRTKCNVAGKVKSIEALGADRYVYLHLTGTTSEDMLKVSTAKPSEAFKVHLCVRGCGEDESGDFIIHAEKARVIQDITLEEDWILNLESVRRPAPVDELALLREREVGEAPREPKEKATVSSSSSSAKSKKKKKKAKKKKEKKKKKKRAEKDKKVPEDPAKEEKGKRPDGTSPMVDSTKTLEALFSGTGLDPKERVRKKVVKKARSYLGKRNKEKDSSTGSSSSTSSSEKEGEDPEEMRLFNETGRALPGGPHSGVAGCNAGGPSPGNGGRGGNVWPKALGFDVCSTTVEQESIRPGSSRSSKSLYVVGPHHQREPCKGGRRDVPEVEITGTDPRWFALVGGSKVGVHGAGQPKHLQQERGQDSPERDIRRREDEAASGSPGAEKRRPERKGSQRKDKGRERRGQRKGPLGAEREEGWEGRRTQRKPRQGLRREPQGEAVVKEAASDSLEVAGVCGSQLPVESMKSGVVTPCKLVDESLSGDWPFRAVPSGEISTGIFPSQPSDRTISGATDPGSSLVDAPGSLRVSGEKVQRDGGMEQFCLGKLGARVLQGFLEVLPLRSKTMEVRNGGSLFPLPSSRDRLKNLFPTLDENGLSWLGLSVSLNSLWGGREFSNDEITPCQKECLRELVNDVLRVVSLRSTLPGFSWKEFFETRNVDYQGEEVKIAKRFKWDNIRHALPAEIGRVPLRELCSHGAQHFVDNIDLYIKPKEQWGKITSPKVMVGDADWDAVCRGLIACGLCCALPREEVFSTGEGPLLNGMFGVTKDEVVEGTEVYRLIMNLIPFNSISESLAGDVGTLPTWSSMMPLFLQPHEKLLVSSEDVRCFFYTMSVPGDWVKYLAFNKQIPDAALPEGLRGRECYLASLVLPMGYLNSVSLAQHVHRNLALASGRHRSSGKEVNSPEHELRKDLPFPDCDPRWRIYLDNYDLLERVESTKAVSLEGTEAPGVAALKAEYEYWEVPRNHKKSTSRSMHAEVQGAQVDGSLGVAYPKESKLLKYVMAALHLCDQSRATQRQLQVVCGGLVYISMFRRPLLGCLNAVWSFISSFETAPGKSKVLPIPCKLEILRFLCLVPVARMDFRLSLDHRVSCSDASEHGGGLCSSVGLSGLGQLASAGALRGHPGVFRDSDPVLCVGIFDGIGALRVALDLLGCRVLGYVSIESNEAASRVVEGHFPGVEVVKDVKLVDQALVHRLAGQFSQASLVLLGAGPPCQGVSGLNVDRKGALRDERSGLFPHVSRIRRLFKVNFLWCQVHSLMESVASMDEIDCQVMSDDFGSTPWSCDAGHLTWCNRPRLYWLTWELLSGPGAEVLPQEDAPRDKVVLKSSQPVPDVCKAGWLKVDEARAFPTFTTSRPRSKPGRKPAGIFQCDDEDIQRWQNDCHRFPPYQYTYHNCLINRKNDIRLPDAEEREFMLGFPVGYTRGCLPKNKRKDASYNDVRLTLLGNSWSVPVVAWFLGQLLAPLGFVPPHSPQVIMDKLKPEHVQMLQAKLFRPPLNPIRETASSYDQGDLVGRLTNLLSIKGEDILLTTPTDQMVKYHRLRATIPSRLWKWKIISGWKWTGAKEHINSLELRAILTSIKWRICHQKLVRKRFLHLTDSLVCLHCVSRGRSSSKKLRRSMCRISALLLASSCHCLWGYVRTDQNPADKPSRWNVRRATKFKHA